ncbi:MAG: 2-oxoglutarate dehydrogenase E1 component [Gammaproteobacteria bacterium]|jgi:2-oxoglutarate dehydrogenase E1 component
MQKETMKAMRDSSALAGGNSAYLESMFEQYLVDPNSVPAEWRDYFQKLPAFNGSQDVSHRNIQQQFKNLSHQMVTQAMPQNIASHHTVSLEHERKQIQVTRLINAYRLQGHLHAQIDPLGMRECEDVNATELTLEDHGLTVSDMATVFDVETFVGPKQMPLGELYQALNDSYCGSIGTEFMHLSSPEERAWIQERLEGTRCQPKYSNEIKQLLLERLTAAEGLEKYIGAKYPGAKRFSLEGGDALIFMLDEMIQRLGSHGSKEVVIGMAHRGRLNVLINTLGKNPRDLFDEFEGKHRADIESGDVKYHQGFSSDVQTSGGVVHVALAFNPSHLEIVTPVVGGSVKARQFRRKDTEKKGVVPIAIHGDAAFSGQGVVMETFNMSQTRGYGIGGTIHIVINNQIGFTTSHRYDSRSTLYCSDIAKTVQAPILHVNTDDAEAVLLATQIVVDYRQQFKKDIVLDLVCYRRHGHNEADEPAATQPLMYKTIRRHPTARQIYATELVKQGVLSQGETDELVNKNREMLSQGMCVARAIVNDHKPDFSVDWTPHFSDDWKVKVKTGLTQEQVRDLGTKLATVPNQFGLHPRVQKIVEDRLKMAQGEIPCDWGFAECLAYASLIEEGYPIRISGQDCGRGTFFHRHAVLHEQNTGEAYIPLQHIKENQSHFTVIDSVLSEEAVLAFEYGFASTDPKSLVIWEAQFGDFANGAQVVIDQFISSGEQKWGRLCGLVMLLPHGYEGQGPEHSSARLERYLQLCAQHNIQVCVPSNASQVFHMLRRQMIRPMRTPLIVMSPKSLLRHKSASCMVDDLINGSFKLVIPENANLKPEKVTRVVLCSGKVYYDLADEREKQGLDNTAIIRIEQLYPFPKNTLKTELARYTNAKTVVWCQEEPKNQGAWYCSQHHFQASLSSGQTLHYAGRPASAAPAVGYTSQHQEQQLKLIQDALFDVPSNGQIKSVV